MPIVSTNLINHGPISATQIRVTEQHTDTTGFIWEFTHNSADEAEALADIAARDLTSSLRARDFKEIRDHVAQGFDNNPGTFEYVSPLRDITELEAEDEIVTFAASEEGDGASPFAWWIQNMNLPTWKTIEIRIGYTSDEGDEIRARMTDIIAADARYNVTIDDPR